MRMRQCGKRQTPNSKHILTDQLRRPELISTGLGLGLGRTDGSSTCSYSWHMQADIYPPLFLPASPWPFCLRNSGSSFTPSRLHTKQRTTDKSWESFGASSPLVVPWYLLTARLACQIFSSSFFLATSCHPTSLLYTLYFTSSTP